MKMETVKCPKCNSAMQEFDVKSKRASKYEDCVRRCITCEIGASNAQVNPTFIYNNYRNNIPKKSYDKYLSDKFYTDIEAAKNSSYYELIRNWTIGNMFSKRNFRLINLAPQKLFDKERDSDFEHFKNSLKDDKRFIQLSWESVLQTLKESSIENRLYDELKKRISC